MTEDHNEPLCAQVGHVVASVTLVRCAHRESYTLTAWVNRIDGDDLSETDMQHSVQFGPFDELDEILRAVLDETRLAVVRAQHMPL